MKKFLFLSLLVVATSLSAADRQDPKPVAQPALPAEATVQEPQPIPVAQSDIQAITQAAQFASAYRIAIAALQEKLDSADAETQRAFNRAQAIHPDMPIHTQTWLYTLKPKAAAAKSTPPVIK